MAHLNYALDYTVEVFIIYKNTILLRKHDKYDKWLSVGGHIDLGENPLEAAIREVREEVGLDVTIVNHLVPFQKESDEYTELIPPRFMNQHKITDTHSHVCFVYFATSNSDKIIPEYEDDKSDDWKWLSRDELEKMKNEISDTIYRYAKTALEEVKVS